MIATHPNQEQIDQIANPEHPAVYFRVTLADAASRPDHVPLELH